MIKFSEILKSLERLKRNSERKSEGLLKISTGFGQYTY